MSRLPPVGYYESVLDGVNRIKSARSAALLDDIFLMTRAPLWSFKRWQAIYRANRFHALNDIYMLKPGEQISYIDPYIVYYNWCADDWPEKWSLGKLSKIYFRIQDKAAFNGTIVLSLSTWGMQTVDVWLNDNPLGSWVLEGKDLELRINSPPGLLQDDRNILGFSLPDARVEDGNPRMYGIAFKSLTVF